MRVARPDRIAALSLGALAIWLFREVLLGRAVFYKRDVHLVWHPQVEAFVRAIAQGSWPVWDPGPAFGQPLLADPSAQILYPLTWLNLLIRPGHYYTIFAFTHVLLSALGLYWLARRWSLSAGGSFVAAALWMLSGPYLSLVDLWHHLAGASWIPWVLLAADTAFETRRLTHALLFGLTLAGQILAGSADMCAMTLLVLAALTGTRLRWGRGSGPSNRALLATISVALLMGMGVSAGLWLPALDIVSRAARGDLPGEIRTYWSVHPLQMMETLIPGLWSNLPLHPAWRSLLFEDREPFLQSLYLGMPALAFVGAAAASVHRWKRFLLSVGAGALVLALGRHTYAWGLVTVLLPPLRILRYPVKTMIPGALAWALLAGTGLDAWRQENDLPRRRWLLLVIAPLVALATLEAGGALAFRREAEVWAPSLLDLRLGGPSPSLILAATETRLVVGAALASVAALLAVAHARHWASARRLAVGLAALVLGDLAVYHRYPNPVAPPALYGHRPEVLDALGDPAEARVYVYDYSVPGKSMRYLGREGAYTLARQPEGWSLEAATALAMQMYLAPQAAGRWGLLQSYDIDYRGLFPAALSRMSLLLRAVEETPNHLRLLRLGGVTHVISLHTGGFQDLVPLEVLPGLFSDPIHLLGVPQTLPRTYVVGGARIAEGVEGLRLLLDAELDPWREIILPPGSGPGALPSLAGVSRVVSAGADRLRLEADLKEPGFVVLLDGFNPGWRATLDAAEVPVLRANLCFRAVRVPRGRHLIEYVYRPRAVVLGLTVSAATLIAGLGLAWQVWRRSRAAERS